MSEMTADTSVAGTEKLLVLDGTTSKTLTTAKMAEYSIDVLATASSATPTTGDDILAFRSGTEKLFDLDATASYIVASGWSVASALTPLTSGDLILAKRSSTIYKTDIDTIKTYTLTGVQATVLDYSGLTTATLADGDLIAVCQTTTGKKATLSALETKLWADYKTYVTGLDAVTTTVDADLFYTIQSGTAKKITADVLADYILAEIGAEVVDLTWDNATTSTTFTDTDNLVFERSGTRRAAEAQYLATYVIAEFMAKSAVTPAADGDKVAMWRSTTPGTMTVDVIASYTHQAMLDDFTTRTTLLDGDTFLFNRSSAGNQVTAANLASYVLDGVQGDVLNLTGLDTATLGGTDLLVVCQSGVGKKTTLSALETKLWADFATYVAGLTDAATVVDADKFYLLNSGTPKYCTATELATYMTAEFWSAAAASSVATGNTLLIDQGGTMKEATVDQLQTFVLTNGQDTILDLSTLTVASGIAGTDTLLLCQGSDPYYVTLSTLGEEVLDDLPAHLDALGAVTTPADADLLYCLQGGVAKKLALSDLAVYTAEQANEFPWTEIAGSKYTSTPSTTSVLLMSDTSDVAVGHPVKYTIGGNVYYAIITAVSANTSITIAGAPLSSTVSNLHVGMTSGVVHQDFFVETAYGASVQDFADLTYRRFRWPRAKAYLVQFSATHGVADTGAAQPKINIKAGGNAVWTNDSSKGLQLSGTPGTWTDSSAVALSTTYYAVDRNEAIDIRCTEVGTNGDADCLSVTLVFVYE
jgi:hypothetical protein